MNKFIALSVSAMIALAACEPTSTAPTVDSYGRPLPKVYRVPSASSGKVQFAVLDSVNVLREAAGAQPLELDSKLTAAAATHSRDMSVQNRPWHFGSDGSSPLDRVARTGYNGTLAGEVISETYETELQTLAAWMEQPDTRAVIMDPAANEMGFAWYQEDNGKIWWTLVTGKPRGIAGNS
ncbi:MULTISPECIES: CAP domain-containing protein [Halocynthiibacter]|uniref:CAP domain-containing protein n=1 Tax=Halocynthiibacter halioticoli TaxID=2986804 RepID=A0AAE3LTQ9_9RHOB|nr:MULTISPECIES: CAP domain-containing protein [Halocynthiibacter]MCV6825581.1 CAP domain-containing protein [Halocynthiibacter halioticoli]MCW4058582.1 CAP domain-containing protein [Halocynthiibacter sp. SDUM655004]MDE0590972.1 CAP domain-containing protein [Halocynthiibacter sp. C4]